jgi:hypothetical protein
VGKKQVHTILKDSEDIYKRWRGGNASQIKKKLKSYSSQIDEVVYEWFCAARYKNAPISGPLIQAKALEVARALNFGSFKASNGWLYIFKTRHILCKTICGVSRCTQGNCGPMEGETVSSLRRVFRKRHFQLQ